MRAAEGSWGGADGADPTSVLAAGAPGGPARARRPSGGALDSVLGPVDSSRSGSMIAMVAGDGDMGRGPIALVGFETRETWTTDHRRETG